MAVALPVTPQIASPTPTVPAPPAWRGTPPAYEVEVTPDPGAPGAAPTMAVNAGPEPIAADDNSDQPIPTISTSAVGNPTIAGAGALDERQGGLSPLIWKGSDARDSEAELALFHSGIASDMLRDLTTRLLMTLATPPAGADDNWFIQRVRTLIVLGADDKADQMISALPASMTTDALHQTRVELMLARGDADNACKNAGSVTDGMFWKKLGILCKARAGQQNEAQLALDVLREENGQETTSFFQESIVKLGDKKALVKDSPREWTTFDVALARLNGDTDKLRDKVETLPPISVKYLAQDAALDQKLHDKLTARARQLGILPDAPGNKIPEPPFATPLASGVTTLVAALGSGNPPNTADNAVIARLALADAGLGDSRRILRLLTLMKPFGYTVPDEVWQKLMLRKLRYDGDMPPAELIARMEDAATAQRKGDVILLAALIAGENDADKIPDLALLPVIRSLKLAGFANEARGLAFVAVKSYSGH